MDFRSATGLLHCAFAETMPMNIRFGAALVLGLLITAPGLRADDTAPINAVLDSFHRAAAAADYNRYVALMAEGIVFLGTDATERWQGQAFADFARPHFDSGRGWDYRPRERRITLSRNGEVAWFDELLSHDKLGTCRGSGVLVNESGEWKVAQYNLSVPIPNELVDGYADGIRAFEAGRAAGGGERGGWIGGRGN